MRLVLGVIDIAYSEGEGTATTGDVAQFLEDQYGVMQVFYEEYRYRIGQMLANALGDQIQDIANGAPVPSDPFQDATQDIEQAFRAFLSQGEIERINPETPTKAAIDGQTKRRKSGKGPRRVSFVDTGLYRNSFRAWIEE